MVNYDVPSSPESYVHRIGRVGRGGREGVAITIAEPREQRLLKTIQRVTKQKIEIAKIPTSADLRARRLEMTRASIYETCLDDDLDAYRVVLDSLTDDFDVVQVALAALKLAHTATSPEVDGEDIPQPDAQDSDGKRRRPRREGAPGEGRGERRSGSRERDGKKDFDPTGKGSKAKGESGSRGGPGKGTKRIFINSGRSAGVRPQDLVGAIANETGLSGRDIGAIQISDRFATVEVPQRAAKDVIRALNSTRLKGNRVKARLDRH